MSSTAGVEICDGDNLAILLALYWVVYMIINAVVFAGAMYGLQQFLEKKKNPSGADGDRGGGGGKSKHKAWHNESRASSRISLVSGGKN